MRVRIVTAAAALLVSILAIPAGGVTPAADQVALFDPATGRWTIRFADASTTTFYYGVPGDTPLLGDWDCDGVDTVAMYRQSNGFIYLRNSNTQGVAEREFFYGLAGDIPLAGDWDGDECDTFAIYRPAEGRVYVSNALGTAPADYSFYFGVPDDRPFAGDWNGDGIDTVGLYRESSGFAYLRNSNSQGVADLQFFYGEPSDRIVAGDWDADGIDTVGIFRPSDARFYLSNANQQGVADVFFSFGQGSWLPAAGHPGEPAPSQLPGPLPALALQTVASGFTQPLYLTAPQGDPRLFVVEKTGRIKVIDGTTTTTFLDLSGLVATDGERGLLGLAFHPAYASNGRFFVSYTNTAGDSRVVEYRVSTTDPDRADPTPSGAPLVAVDQPFSNHNGGMIQFGPDGLLYLGLGDGGGSATANSQDDGTLLGKLVRMNVDTRVVEVWAKGLRNPWRWDFDPATGLLYIADVGQNSWEEVDVVPAGTKGLNYGWPIQEGTHCYSPPSGCSTAGLVQPVLEYPHPEGCSITGGFVYRGTAIPDLAGAYLYSDYCAGFLRGFRYRDGAIAESRDWTGEVGDLGTVGSFGEDGSGELYVLTFDGRVRKIEAAG